MNNDTELEAIVEVLEAAGAFAHGGAPRDVAEEWRALGFINAEVGDWLEARCFDADAADTLRTLGVLPEQAAAVAAEYVGIGGYVDTIGYKVSNGDLSAGVGAILAQLSDEQIEALKREAATAGDTTMIYDCMFALDGSERGRYECAKVIARSKAQS